MPERYEGKDLFFSFLIITQPHLTKEQMEYQWENWEEGIMTKQQWQLCAEEFLSRQGVL